MFGLAFASYLAYIHYAGIKALSGRIGGCEIVQISEYSKLVGVPGALIGLIGYVTILAHCLRGTRDEPLCDGRVQRHWLRIQRVSNLP